MPRTRHAADLETTAPTAELRENASAGWSFARPVASSLHHFSSVPALVDRRRTATQSPDTGQHHTNLGDVVAVPNPALAYRPPSGHRRWRSPIRHATKAGDAAAARISADEPMKVHSSSAGRTAARHTPALDTTTVAAFLREREHGHRSSTTPGLVSRQPIGLQRWRRAYRAHTSAGQQC
jgi:hypothetical protein